MIPDRIAMARPVVRQEFDFHFRHVDARRTFALAALAADAQIHGLAHGNAREGVGAELAGEGEPQGVGASAGQMLLVAGDSEARAHRAGVELPAMAVVVAHLDGLRESAGVVAAGSRGRDPFGRRVVLHIPGRPIERRCERERPVGHFAPKAAQSA